MALERVPDPVTSSVPEQLELFPEWERSRQAPRHLIPERRLPMNKEEYALWQCQPLWTWERLRGKK